LHDWESILPLGSETQKDPGIVFLAIRLGSSHFGFILPELFVCGLSFCLDMRVISQLLLVCLIPSNLSILPLLGYAEPPALFLHFFNLISSGVTTSSVNRNLNGVKLVALETKVL
jgi:hypothetical protein